MTMMTNRETDTIHTLVSCHRSIWF